MQTEEYVRYVYEKYLCEFREGLTGEKQIILCNRKYQLVENMAGKHLLYSVRNKNMTLSSQIFLDAFRNLSTHFTQI